MNNINTPVSPVLCLEYKNSHRLEPVKGGGGYYRYIFYQYYGLGI